MTGVKSIITLALALTMNPSVYGFSIINHSMKNQRLSTKIFLKDSIADMIDKELLRLQHKKEIEKEITAKIQELNKEILPTNYEYNEDFENSSDSIVHHKDEKMAHDDPQRYCADRCVATGHCDVFEDLYDLSPVQVIEFCTDCVLSEEEEPCNVPDAMFEDVKP